MRNNTNYDVDSLKVLIEEVKGSLKKERENKARIERILKGKQQELRSLSLSSFKVAPSNKLVKQLEILGKILSDKLEQIASVKQEVHNLQDSYSSLSQHRILK